MCTPVNKGPVNFTGVASAYQSENAGKQGLVDCERGRLDMAENNENRHNDWFPTFFIRTLCFYYSLSIFISNQSITLYPLNLFQMCFEARALHLLTMIVFISISFRVLTLIQALFLRKVVLMGILSSWYFLQKSLYSIKWGLTYVNRECIKELSYFPRYFS